MVTDEQGQQVWSAEYSPFGMKNSVDGKLDHATKFTGKDLDEDTGLYYFNARWYDQDVGRFISEDLARDGLNWYIYCKNNPLYYSDPDGQAAESFLDKIIEFQNNLNYFPSRLNFGYIKGASNAVVTTAKGLHNVVKVVTPSGYIETMSESRALGTKIGKHISRAIQNPKEAYESVKASVIKKTIDTVSKVGDYIQTRDQEVRNGDWGNLVEDYGNLAGYAHTQVAIGVLTEGAARGGSKVGKIKPDFYVTASGDAIPSTGYRYMSSDASYINNLKNTMIIPENPSGTYISFKKYYFASPGELQVPLSSDAAMRGTFDTLQITDNIRIPNGLHGSASWLEPLTKDYPEFGIGGATQAITTSPIVLYDLTLLPKK